MFANKSFSNVGRKTAQSIDTLKKRLGVDACGENVAKSTGAGTANLLSSASGTSLAGVVPVLRKGECLRNKHYELWTVLRRVVFRPLGLGVQV